MMQYQTWLEEIWQKVDNKLSKVAIRSRNKIPYTAIDGVHDNRGEKEIDWWTNGFWGGMMWLMYHATKNEDYKITAEHSQNMLNEALKNYKVLHHDVGFMWHLTAGANYRLTGDKASCDLNLYMASMLFSRYHVHGEFIRAWNGYEQRNWTIIDTMMNIPLLYWASREIGDDRFRHIAEKHADMAIRDHIRPDGSVNHIVEHDEMTGELVKTYGGQGYCEGSCWSRGQAWALYGSVLSYIHTGEKKYLDAAVKVANYFVANCAPTHFLTPIDFRMPAEDEYYDSTAGVCAACGLIELSKALPGREGSMYLEAAVKILQATAESFCNFDESVDFLVGMGSERYPHENTKGLHIPIIYADFFFVEALLKLKNDDFLIW
ncbi:MAG: glycoside hydrolase family 88 protein [Clostridia bacterium]|nr:glycoside hydrolase family 88 protein [Clostridia bacterium]